MTLAAVSKAAPRASSTHRLPQARHDGHSSTRGAHEDPPAADPMAKWTFEAFIRDDKMPGSPRPVQHPCAACEVLADGGHGAGRRRRPGWCRAARQVDLVGPPMLH